MEIVSAPWAFGSCLQSTDVEQRCVSGGENLWKVPQLDSSENTGGVKPDASSANMPAQRQPAHGEQTGPDKHRRETQSRELLKGSVLLCLYEMEVAGVDVEGEDCPQLTVHSSHSSLAPSSACCQLLERSHAALN